MPVATPGRPHPPGNLATTTAFNDYWLGVDHARTNARGVAYPAPSSAAAAGVAEYWAGVDHAVANPQAIAPPAGNSASAQGATDYWAGENHALANRAPPMGAWASSAAAFQDFWAGVAHARASIVNFQAAAPPGRVRAAGFAAYRQGVLAADAMQANNPANPAFADGWSDYRAGEADVRAQAVNALRTDSGYVYGVRQTPAPQPKRRNNGDGPPGKKRKGEV